VVRFVPPEEFAALKRIGLEMGFRHVESGPLVRSSYHAHKHVQPVSTFNAQPGRA
jgi:lipoic acid synthetase